MMTKNELYELQVLKQNLDQILGIKHMFSPYNYYIIYVRQLQAKRQGKTNLCCRNSKFGQFCFYFLFIFFFKGENVEVRLELIIKLYYIFKYTSSLFFFPKSLIVQLTFCGISSGDRLGSNLLSPNHPKNLFFIF